MRAVSLVSLAAASALLAVWSLLAPGRHSRQQTVFSVQPWPTVPPLHIPAAWLDTGGDLNSQMLKRFVLEFSKKKSTLMPSTQPTSSVVEVNKGSATTSAEVSCPQTPVVAVQDGGRLGNKLWEYAAVWGLSQLLDRPGFVPSSMLHYLGHVFHNLTLSALESVAHCKLQFSPPLKRHLLTPLTSISKRYPRQNLMLHKWIFFPEIVLLYQKQLRNEFKFLPTLLKEVQETYEIINKNNKYKKNTTYIGVHVRRTDFKTWLPLKFNRTLIGADYFLDAMEWFRKKFNESHLKFLIVTDDPAWCEKELVLKSKDTILVSKIGNTSPGRDLAIFTSCNHTIIDYGTYGEWGALMAGGYTISMGFDWQFNELVSKKPNWIVKNNDK